LEVVVNKFFDAVSLDGTPGFVRWMKNMKLNKNTNKTPGRNQNSEAMGQTPEQWWARLKPVERRVAQVIAAMMDEVTAEKRVEIRREAESIRARFIHILRQPEPGCVSAIVLPEASNRACN
jgi:hypothetical protein